MSHIIVQIGLFSSMLFDERTISVGSLLNEVTACGLGTQVSDQSATVSVSGTSKRQIVLSGAERSHPHDAFSHDT